MVARAKGLIAMSDPTIDDKIERLVRSVLEAVDARLAEVRAEVQELAAQVALRDAEIARHFTDLEQRLERSAGETRGAVTGTDPLAARMEQATQVLLERIEAMHQRTTIATNERFANVHAALDDLRTGRAAPAAVAEPLMPSLDAMSAPLRVGPITTQQPIIATATPTIAPLGAAPGSPMPTLEHTSVMPSVPALRLVADEPAAAQPAADATTTSATVASTTTAPAAGAEDGIDLGRLADLLSERLGHLNLPTRPT